MGMDLTNPLSTILDDKTNLDEWQNRDGPMFGEQYSTFPEWQKLTNPDWLPGVLASDLTRLVWIGPNNKWWELAGPFRGKQGVIAINAITGLGMVPFEHKYSEGPYLPGATLERVDIRKRLINFGVIINPNTNIMQAHHRSSAGRYRQIERSFWTSFSKEMPGFFGIWTRHTGWRWIKCILEPSTKDNYELDPAAFKNNAAKYDVSLVAVDPYFYKYPLYKTWKAEPGKTAKDKDGFWVGDLKLSNRGTVSAAPLYLITCPGQAKLCDGPERMVTMGKTVSADDYYMVDTAENAKTVNGSTDPVDNAFYRFIRQAGLADFFLHDLAAQGLPLWRRWDDPQIFDFEVAPMSNVSLRVAHNYPNAEITAIIPQRFEMAWG